jgi:hypothetical protein
MNLDDNQIRQFVTPHVAYGAGRRRYIDAEDIAWVMARKRQGLSDQSIATMGGMCLSDVQRIRSEHMDMPLVSMARPAYDPTARPAVRYERRFTLQEAPAPASITLHARFSGAPARFGYAVSLIRPQLRSWRSIVGEIAMKHGLKLGDLVGPSRSLKIAHPRQEAMWALKQENRWSLPRIGQLLGGRDHTTVLHGIRRHEERASEAKTSLKVAA